MKNMKYRLGTVLVLSMSLVAVQSYVHVGTVENVYQSQRQKNKLFTKVGCKYMNEMVVNCSHCLVDPYTTEYFKADAARIEILSKKYHADVATAKLAPMYLKYISSTVGYGIFATQPIQKDDFIGIYAGELRYVRWADSEFQEDVDYAWYYPVDGASGKKLIIDGKYRGNELRFINHAKTPNTKLISVIVHGKFYMCYIATRYIPQDAQLTVDYGSSYWQSRHVNPEEVA